MSSSFSERVKSFKQRVLKVDEEAELKSSRKRKIVEEKQNADSQQGKKDRWRASGKKRPRSSNGQNTNDEKSKPTKNLRNSNDPSTKYIKAPLSAPIVRDARKFMLSTGKLTEFKLHLGPTKSWRNTAKLSVRGNPPAIGLFAPKSHKVLPMHSSLAHHPSINRATSMLAAAVKHVKVTGYDGKNPGGLSYVAFNVEIETSKVQLVMVFNNEFSDDLKATALAVTKFIQKQDPSILHSTWLHCHPCSKHDNSIFSREPGAWHLLTGDESIVDCLSDIIAAPLRSGGKKRDASGKKRRKRDIVAAAAAYREAAKERGELRPMLYFPPFVFRQANVRAFAKIIVNLKEWVPENSDVVELYGGVGTIGLNILDKVRSLSCSDENPHNKACFERSLEGLDLKERKVEYVSSGAAQVALNGGLQDASVVVVDPPRKGLDQEVIDAVSQAKKLKTFIYVSCGFNAFQRDCVSLQSIGFEVVHGEGHVLFPGSNHIETLAVFQRK